MVSKLKALITIVRRWTPTAPETLIIQLPVHVVFFDWYVLAVLITTSKSLHAYIHMFLKLESICVCLAKCWIS